MAEINAASVMALLCLILASTSMTTSECFKFEKPAVVAREADVPVIKCQVCKKLAIQLKEQIKQAEKSPDEVVQIAQNLCKFEQAVWIRKIGIVGQGEKSKLEERGPIETCDSDCRTIERACQEITEEFKRGPVNLSQEESFLCENVTTICKSKTEGKVLRRKESRKGDLKHKFTGVIKTIWKGVKRGAEKVLRPDSKKKSKTGKSEL